MTSKLSVIIFLLTLAPAVFAAQNPVLLGSDDIYFTFDLAEQPLRGTGHVSMVHARTRLCGFQIRGNHRNTANPRAEWDMNIDAIHLDAGWTPGIWAGAFDVVGQDRKPRPPIVNLSFSIQGDPQSIPAQIVGSPNTNNAIKAVLETEPASRLFSALSGNNHLITIALTYKDNSSDVVQIRGYRDGTSGGKNSLFNQCLRGYTPIRRGTRPVP